MTIRIKKSCRIFVVASLVALGGCVTDPPPLMVMENPPPVTTQPTTQSIPPGRVVAAGILQVGGRFLKAARIVRHVCMRLDGLTKSADEVSYRKQARAEVNMELDRAISRNLVLAEADLELPEDIKAQIEAEVAYGHKRKVTMSGGSEALLARKLLLEDVVLEDLLEDMRRGLTIKKYIDRKLKPKVHITRQMLWDYYRHNRPRFRFGKKMRMRIIAVPVVAMPDGRKGARALVDKAAKAIKDGKDFGKVAAETAGTIKSYHGDKWDTMLFTGKSFVTRMVKKGGLCVMSPTSLTDNVLAAAATKLEQDQISDVIVTERACYLVWAEKVRSATDTSFADAQTEIRLIITGEMMAMYEDEYLAGLRERFEKLQGPQGQALKAQFADIVLNRVMEKYKRKAQ